jgi:hypothetical protein
MHFHFHPLHQRQPILAASVSVVPGAPERDLARLRAAQQQIAQVMDHLNAEGRMELSTSLHAALMLLGEVRLSQNDA